MSLNRRNFLKIAGIASVSKVFANTNQEKMAKLIDLSLCDGCANLATPLCVSACKVKNKDVFPKPISEIPNYYPQKFYEDYQDKKDEINRLNPYNFIYVEKLNIDDKNINIPRHCMHCDDPTCLKICPFGAISKDNSAVKINPNVCFGGAKCKDVCPWHIPQRQAGVGAYLKIAPKLAGGGVMYKCDLCADISIPTCVSACPKNAMIYANKEKIKLLALKKAQEYKDLAKDDGTYIYGDKQNGGTATFYVSPISFEKIQEAINKKHANNTQGIAHMKVDVNNKITSNDKIIKSVLLSPIAGVLAGVLLRKKMKIKRQSIFNQITHLGIMISVFALIFSGILQMPVAKRYMIYKLPLMSWSVDYYISLMVHYIFSISLIFFVFLHITYYILRKDFSILPKKGDIKKSIKLIYAIIFNKEEEPCEKYLPEQRLAYLGLVIIMAVLIITGLIKTYKNLAGISISENSIFLVALLHNIGMFLMIFWIFIHLFAFVFETNRALLGAMFGGKIDAKYVLKRHKLWHEGVKAAKKVLNML